MDDNYDSEPGNYPNHFNDLYRPRRADTYVLVRDAPLTDLGREQCRQLDEQSKDTIQEEAELVVVSPVSPSPGGSRYAELSASAG